MKVLSICPCIRNIIETYQRVLLPASPAVTYSGRDGTTVGTGATELVANGTVAVAKAFTGSTIMLTGVVVFELVDRWFGGWDSEREGERAWEEEVVVGLGQAA